MAIIKAAAASALALLVAGPAFAQGAIIGTDALDEQIDDVNVAVREEFRRGVDPERFGPSRFQPGFSGSMSLAYSGSSGNSEDQDLAVAGRLRFGGEVVNQTLGFGLVFSETTNPETGNSFTSEEETFVIYEANRYFTDDLYGFGLGYYRNDDFDTLQQDAFLGVGLGYRIVNTPSFAWRVQAGPGVRWSEGQDDLDVLNVDDEFVGAVDDFTDDEFTDAFDANLAPGEEETEVAGIASSRLFYELTDTVSVSNDTDILFSDSISTLIRNDLGVNFGISERISTRVGYRTDYYTDPLPGLESTDNRLNVALVFGF